MSLCKKSPNPFFVKMHHFHSGKSSLTICAASVCNFKKLPEVNNRTEGENWPNLGPMLWFFKYFRRKILQKIGVFDSKQSKFLKKLIITLVFKKNANFFAKNWEKSQKIVIITSTPGLSRYMYVHNPTSVRWVSLGILVLMVRLNQQYHGSVRWKFSFYWSPSIHTMHYHK
jgi:hypothetical protein